MTIIEEYIKNVAKEKQDILTELYELIKKTAPEATEKLSYGMPTFDLNGNLVHFAPAKMHLGFYPTPSAIEQFSDELAAYKTSKGAIQFPYNQKLPIDLIKRIVLFRVQENLEK